jgi:hypothetical protein
MKSFVQAEKKPASHEPKLPFSPENSAHHNTGTDGGGHARAAGGNSSSAAGSTTTGAEVSQGFYSHAAALRSGASEADLMRLRLTGSIGPAKTPTPSVPPQIALTQHLQSQLAAVTASFRTARNQRQPSQYIGGEIANSSASVWSHIRYRYSQHQPQLRQ